MGRGGGGSVSRDETKQQLRRRLFSLDDFQILITYLLNNVAALQEK